MRMLAALGSLVLGVAVAAASIALHQLWWGLLLGAAASLATLVALPAGWWSRAAYALGFVVLLVWAMRERPEGDYVIPADGSGYALLGLGVVVLVVSVVTLPRARRR